MANTLDVDGLIAEHSLTALGESANTDYFALDDDVLVGIPRQGSLDDGSTAQSNADFQIGFFRERGRKGGVVIFFDRMANQNREARKVYAEMDVAVTATALVGGSALTRAMASFFLGIARPKVPVKLFADFEGAVRWLRSVNATADRALAPAREPR